MSLPDEQIRAQRKAWDVMTGPRKNWTRENFRRVGRHLVSPTELALLFAKAGKISTAMAYALIDEMNPNKETEDGLRTD
jgi:hypothetical protein